MTERLLVPAGARSAAEAGSLRSSARGRSLWLEPEAVPRALAEGLRRATDSAGRCNVEEARRRFHEFAARLTARGGMLQPAVGRVTRVGVEILGESLDGWDIKQLAPRVPGRDTLVAAEARRRAHHELDSAAADAVALPVARPDLPGASDVMRAKAALLGVAPPDRTTAPTTDPGIPARRLLDLRAWAPPGGATPAN